MHVLSNTQATIEALFMKKLSNSEAEFEKGSVLTYTANLHENQHAIESSQRNVCMLDMFFTWKRKINV